MQQPKQNSAELDEEKAEEKKEVVVAKIEDERPRRCVASITSPISRNFQRNHSCMQQYDLVHNDSVVPLG